MRPILVRCFIDSSISEESNRGNTVSSKNDVPGIKKTTRSTNKNIRDIAITFACVTFVSNPLAIMDPLCIRRYTSSPILKTKIIPAHIVYRYPTWDKIEKIYTIHTEIHPITIPSKNRLLFQGVSSK